MFVRIIFTLSVAIALGASSRLLPEATPRQIVAQTSETMVEAQRIEDARLRDSFLRVVDVRLAGHEIALADLAHLNGEERAALQAAPYHAHLHASARIGVPLGRVEQLERVQEGSPYYVTGWDGLLAAEAIKTLDLIGRRFHEACRVAGAPPVRFIVTSTYRSAEKQAELRTENANATHGRSSHEYGGSFDIAYERFLPLLDPLAGTGLLQVDGTIPPRVYADWQAAAEAREAQWAREIAKHHAATYDAILGRVLVELERERRVLTLREYRQTCYHVTAVAERRA